MTSLTEKKRDMSKMTESGKVFIEMKAVELNKIHNKEKFLKHTFFSLLCFQYINF